VASTEGRFSTGFPGRLGGILLHGGSCPSQPRESPRGRWDRHL